MSHAIAAVSQSQAAQVTPETTKPSPKAAAPKAAAPPQDTVQVSNAAKAAYAELTETKTQTQQEANHGDAQARRLLAREQTAQPAKQ